MSDFTARAVTDSEVVAEWKRRRSTTWRAIRIALLVFAIAGGAFWFPARTSAYDMTGRQLLITFSIFLVCALAACMVIFRTKRLYRCPRCNTVPMGASSTSGQGSFSFRFGVELNPTRCPNCGANLR